ncbi:MAG: hypothetical protein AB8E82_14770 [Aureispira sp.]
MKKYSKLKIVNSHLNYDHVTLVEPSNHYYLHIAVEVDKVLTPFYFFESSLKKKLIKNCQAFCAQLLRHNHVVEANVFKAILIPPGRSKFIIEHKSKVNVAKFDLAILIEVDSKEALLAIQNEAEYATLIKQLKENSRNIHQTETSNAKRIGAVDHSTQGVFLFNYFYADDLEQNLEVWNYTAGWFEKETKLDNSTLLLPLTKDTSDYSVINHCRWDNLTAILPSLVFKKTFREYVLDNFYKNNVGAMPILYKLVR